MQVKMSTIKLPTTWKRLLAVLIIGWACFFTGVECKRSACWRYGHVCWGGHGKRSGQAPVIPPSGSREAGDGSDLLSPQWNLPETDRVWKLYPKQSMPIPLYIKPYKVVRQPMSDNSNVNGQKSPLLMMQRKLSKQPHVLTRVLSPMMFEQNERRMNQLQMESDDRNSMDDVLSVPNSSMTAKGSSSHEMFPAALKRSPLEEGNANNGAGGGTEEPLETLSNGLDSDSVATFFRDRKSKGKITAHKNPERERFSNFQDENIDNMLGFPRQSKFSSNIFGILPLSQYGSDITNFSKTKVHY